MPSTASPCIINEPHRPSKPITTVARDAAGAITLSYLIETGAKCWLVLAFPDFVVELWFRCYYVAWSFRARRGFSPKTVAMETKGPANPGARRVSFSFLHMLMGRGNGGQLHLTGFP